MNPAKTENLKSTFGSTTMSGRIGLPSISPARLFRSEIRALANALAKLTSVRGEIQPFFLVKNSSNHPPNTAKMVSINDKNHDDRRVMVVNKLIFCQV
jgi:hypothetical protein